MFRSVKDLKPGRLLLVFLSLSVLMTSSVAQALAADNASEEIELKRSDFRAQGDAGPEGPEGPESVEKRDKSPTNESLKSSSSDRSSDDPDSDAGAGSNSNQSGSSESNETPMPTPSLLKQANPSQDQTGSVSNPGGRAPFNLGIRQSVMDGGIDDEGTNLQGGAATTVENQFPTLGVETNKQAPLKGETSGTTLKGGLTQAQLQKLASHDLVLIIDQSGSMNSADCPIPGAGRIGGAVLSVLLGSVACVSRWQWCREQTMHLAEQTRYASAKGLSVVLFSSTYSVNTNVTLDQIPRIFNRTAPGGDTNLTEPLLVTIRDYLQRRNLTRGNVKPIAIAIITDGRPNSEETVRQAIVETTYKMRYPDEVSITIFLIGNSAFTGQSFVTDLERNLTRRYGARYNIVKAVPFGELIKIGLARALADSL